MIKKIVTIYFILAVCFYLTSCSGESTNCYLNFIIINSTNEDLHFDLTNNEDETQCNFELISSKEKFTFTRNVAVQHGFLYQDPSPNFFLRTKEYEDSLCKITSYVNVDSLEKNIYCYSAYVCNLKKKYTENEFSQFESKLTRDEFNSLFSLYNLNEGYHTFNESFFNNSTNDQIELEIAYYNNISLKISEEIQKSVFVVQNYWY